MKNIMALIAFTVISSVTMYLAVKKRIDSKTTSIFLVFAIISGLAIANYDLITKFKWGDMEVETAKREIGDAKKSALEEIRSEVKEQKESIKLLISNANETKEEIEKQKIAMNELIIAATDLQSRIEKQKEKIIDLNKAAENTKNDIEKLNIAASQIALILVRATYFTIETKSEIGTDRAQKAIQETLNDLNRILPMVITDEKERTEWVNKLQNTLPSRK